MSHKHGIGMYKTESEVISAVSRLLEIGYRHDEISVLVQNPERFQQIGAATEVRAKSPQEAGTEMDREEAQHYKSALDRGEFLVLVAADKDRRGRVDGAFRWPDEPEERPAAVKRDGPPELVKNPMREPDVDPDVDFEGHPKEQDKDKHS